MNNLYVEHLPEWHLILCRKCEHAIWPEQVQQHFQGSQHRLPKFEAVTIASIAQSWSGLIQYPVELHLPRHVNAPIPGLKLFHEGFLCQIQPEDCWYVCRNEKGMKTHCRQKHGWTMQSQRGRPSARTGSKTKPWRSVSCQRFFLQGVGSQYFEIRNVNVTMPNEVNV